MNKLCREAPRDPFPQLKNNDKRFDHKHAQREDDHRMGEEQVGGMPGNDRDSQQIAMTRKPKAQLLPGVVRERTVLLLL